MQLICPAYFRPSQYGWATWLAATNARALTDLIVNCNSGPGDKIDPIYVNAVGDAKRHSKQVHGYVHTQWGQRPLNVVLNEVRQWFDWYAVDGIFFDEASTQLADIPYYKQLYDAVPGKVLTNQGTVTPPEYSAVTNVVCDRETTWANYQASDPPSKLTVPRYHIILDCKQPIEALLLAHSRGVRYVYITDDAETDDEDHNPYDRLPSYWRALNNQAAVLV